MSLRRHLARLLDPSLAPVAADPPAAIDMRALRPPLPALGGHGRQAICDSLCAMSLDGHDPAMTAGYARADCERFIRTVDLVPDGRGRALEIGGNPYFISLLLRWYRPGFALDHTNFFVETSGTAIQHVRVPAPGGAIEEHEFTYHNVNIEAPPPQDFPFADASLDGVLFCEVIEHLQMNPLRALREIWRILKPGGWLILTTPNVARLVNAVRMIDGDNFHDPYSGHGPYGRHNREYSISELNALMPFCGYEADVIFTSDVHDESVPELHVPPALARLLKHRENELGQYIFSRWRKGATPPRKGKPSWLYASYPAELTIDLPYPHR